MTRYRLFTVYQLYDRLRSFIEEQEKINFSCTREEEIDFEGLVKYVQENLLEDVQERLFGNRKERGVARTTIISKSIAYSQAHTSLSRQRVIWIIETATDILKEFYKKKSNRELLFIAAQIEDNVDEIIGEHLKDTEMKILDAVEKKVDGLSNMAVEKNMQLIKRGEIEQVEDALSNWFAAIGSVHNLSPDYRFEYRSEDKHLYSKPITKEALEKYPPRIVCTGTIQMNGINLDRFDVDTIDYANRHQLPITLNVITARKFLGDVEDPIQHEANNLIGESIVIPPKPFPPAFPCSLSLDGDVMFDYILLRVQEVLDDGSIVISNQEQRDCPFRIKLSAELTTGKTIYSVDTINPTNGELLQYLRFLIKAAESDIITIKVLSLGEVLATGRLGNVEYKSGLDRIQTELDFLEKIVTIEHYYEDIIAIPEEIMSDDFQIITYLSMLINGDECKGFWTKLEFPLVLTEELKERLLEEEDKKFTLSYICDITVSIYGKSYTLPVIRSFDSVIYENLNRIKQKVEILDVGDMIKMSFLPGNGEKGMWRDCKSDIEIDDVTLRIEM